MLADDRSKSNRRIARGNWCISLRHMLLLFGHAMAYTLAEAQSFAFWSSIGSYYCSCSGQSCIGLGFCLGSCLYSYFCLLVMHRRILLSILRFELMLGHGHEPVHEFDFEMTKRQKYDYKHEFEPEHELSYYQVKRQKPEQKD